MSHWGWSKKCRKSVTYYLNGPLSTILSQTYQITNLLSRLADDRKDRRRERRHRCQLCSGSSRTFRENPKICESDHADDERGCDTESGSLLRSASRGLLEQQLHVPLRRPRQPRLHEDLGLPADEIRMRLPGPGQFL
jgi:hypothetical protein